MALAAGVEGVHIGQDDIGELYSDYDRIFLTFLSFTEPQISNLREGYWVKTPSLESLQIRSKRPKLQPMQEQTIWALGLSLQH